MTLRRRFSSTVLAVAGAVLSACASTAPPGAARAPEFFPSPENASLSLPFSEAVRAGDFLFVSGQIGNLPGKRELAPGGIAAESEQALANIEAILARHGASIDSVVKCTVFLADIRDWSAFNDVYRRHFPRRLPARSALAAGGLVLGARVEIDCIAYAPTTSGGADRR